MAGEPPTQHRVDRHVMHVGPQRLGIAAQQVAQLEDFLFAQRAVGQLDQQARQFFGGSFHATSPPATDRSTQRPNARRTRCSRTASAVAVWPYSPASAFTD